MYGSALHFFFLSYNNPKQERKKTNEEYQKKTRKGQEMWCQKRIRRKRQKPSERCIGANLISLKWGFFVPFFLE